MAGNNVATSGNSMSNAWANAASKLNSFMQSPSQVNGVPGSTGTTGGRRRRKSKKGMMKRSRKAGRKSRRHRKKKILGFEIF